MYTSILPVERRYTLFECSNVKLYYRQEKSRRTRLRDFIAYAVVCKHSMRPRKRYRRAPAAFRRLFIRPSGRGCLRLSMRRGVVSCCDRLRRLACCSLSVCHPAASGQAVHGRQVSRSGVPSKGGSSLPSVLALSVLFVSAHPPKSRKGESREPESRKRVVRES